MYDANLNNCWFASSSPPQDSEEASQNAHDKDLCVSAHLARYAASLDMDERAELALERLSLLLDEDLLSQLRIHLAWLQNITYNFSNAHSKTARKTKVRVGIHNRYNMPPGMRAENSEGPAVLCQCGEFEATQCKQQKLVSRPILD